MTEKDPQDTKQQDSDNDAPQLMDNGRSTTMTESIDLSGLFTKDLTSSGSFDVGEIKKTSFGKLLRVLPMPACLIEKTGHITFCNEGWGRITRKYQDLEWRLFSTLFPRPDEASAVSATVKKIFAERIPQVVAAKMLIDDRPVWARIFFRSLRLAGEQMVMALLEDVTLEKRQLLLMDTIQRGKREWERTFDTVPDLTAILDTKLRIVRLNRAMAARVGIPITEGIGKTCHQLIHGTDAPPPYCPFSKALANTRRCSADYYEEKLQGFFSESLSPIRTESGHVSGCVCVIRDMTERKQLEEDLKRRATHDALTDLLNLTQMLEILYKACETSKRYGHSLSLSVCDIDYFRQVNEAHGHWAGNQVLVNFGHVVTQELRGADVAARYGGDTFIVAFPNTSLRGAVECMERILSRLEQIVFQSETGQFRVTATAGVAEFDPDTMDSEELIQAADRALHQAKIQARNRVGTDQD